MLSCKEDFSLTVKLLIVLEPSFRLYSSRINELKQRNIHKSWTLGNGKTPVFWVGTVLIIIKSKSNYKSVATQLRLVQLFCQPKYQSHTTILFHRHFIFSYHKFREMENNSIFFWYILLHSRPLYDRMANPADTNACISSLLHVEKFAMLTLFAIFEIFSCFNMLIYLSLIKHTHQHSRLESN